MTGQAPQIREHLHDRGILSAREAKSARIAVAIGDVARRKDRLSRRYVVAIDGTKTLNIQFLPSPWPFELRDILETRERYARIEAFTVPRLFDHFATEDGHCFVEEHVESAVSLASLVDAGELTGADAAQIVKGILDAIWATGTPASDELVQNEQAAYREYLRLLIPAGMLGELLNGHIDSVLSAVKPDLRRVMSTGDIMDRNIVRVGARWYVTDFEYCHPTIFFFKEAYRSLLHSPWASGMSLREFCPSIQQVPEDVASVVAVAWEKHLYVELLDERTGTFGHETLRCRLWNVVEPGLIAQSDRELSAFQEVVRAMDGEFAELSASIDSSEELVAELRADLQNREERINVLSGEVADLTADVRVLRSEIMTRDHALHQFQRSMSWRVTAPLRMCYRVLVQVLGLLASTPLVIRLYIAPLRRRLAPLRRRLELPRVRMILRGLSPLRPHLERGEAADRTSAYETVDLAVASKTGSYEDPVPMRASVAPVKIVAFYLPQFHPIPENDRWWGEGFTDWRNVARAKPLFKGHYQPRLPGALGFYDLRLKEVMERQIELARQFGIHGFCFHHYWFDGRRLLERPVEQLLADPALDIPFCLCWANENWTRRWDGFDQEILIEQDHSAKDDTAFITEMLRFFQDSRYIRLDGKPLLLVYRPQILPDPVATVGRWRAVCQVAGFELYCVAAQTFGHSDPRVLGFDGAVQFPPHNPTSLRPVFKTDVSAGFLGEIYDYGEWSRGYLRPRTKNEEYPLFRCVSPDWDNTPRRGPRASVFADSTPDKYAQWLEAACADAHRTLAPGRKFVFVNAWNEWAEGAYLEPDLRYGYAYLNRTAQVLGRIARADKDAPLRVLFIGHDAARAGAQMVLLRLVCWLKQNTNFDVRVLLLGDGPLAPRFAEAALLLVRPEAVDCDAFASEVLRFCDQHIDVIFGNTAVAAKVYDSLAKVGAPIITYVHEQEASLQRFAGGATIAKMLRHTIDFIAPSAPTADNLRRRHAVPEDKVRVIPAFIDPLQKLVPTRDARRALCDRFGLPQSAFVVFGCGTLDWRKGADLFVEIARRVRDGGRSDVHFCWIGEGTDAAIPKPEELIARYRLGGQAHLLGLCPDPRELFRGGDLFMLPSREDPFPLVCLEAAECGLPIVCFAGAGGMPDFVGSEIGEVVPHENVDAMAAAVLRLAADEPRREELGRRARAKLLATHVTDLEAPKIASAISSVRTAAQRRLRGAQPGPSVSVLVPNYNYAKYLEERLSSIQHQTYPVHEIIVLDDASADESVATVRRQLDGCSIPMMLVRNAENSGSVFSQWRKGLELATGDLVWIAEADDLSDPRFLSDLQTGFSDGTVLGFCDSKQIDADGKGLSDSYGWYYADLPESPFSGSFSISGTEFVARTLAVKNVILNASSVLFRRDTLIAAFERSRTEIQRLRVAGDWRIYCEILTQPGAIMFYLASSHNIHRRHPNSVTHALDAKRHIEEIAQMQALIGQRVTLSEATRDRARHYLEEVEAQLGRAGTPLCHSDCGIDEPARAAGHAKRRGSSDFWNLLDSLLHQPWVAARLATAKEVPLWELFAGQSDDFWLWCLTEGYKQDARLKQLLPRLPDEETQERFTGRSGTATFEHAFAFKRILLRELAKLERRIETESVVLDFGCGWGRISMTLLKDVKGDNIFAVDVLDAAISTCRSSNLQVRLSTIAPGPPTDFPDSSFDLILSYSVFSHLSEEYFKAWMREFHRILVPRGVVIFTTRPREAIQWFKDLRESGQVPFYGKGAAASFLDSDTAFRDYDAGKFCFAPEGAGGSGLTNSYGEACIPLEYIQNHLSSVFSRAPARMVDFSEHRLFDQNLLVLQK